jgi:hypothetical protein
LSRRGVVVTAAIWPISGYGGAVPMKGDDDREDRDRIQRGLARLGVRCAGSRRGFLVGDALNKANEIEMCLGQPNCDTLVEAHEAWPVRQL